MALKKITVINRGTLQEAPIKAVYRDDNGNVISSHPLSKRDKKQLNLPQLEGGEKTKTEKVYALLIIIGILGIAGMYLLS